MFYHQMTLPGLDVLINNAGIDDHTCTITETPNDLVQKIFTVNCFAPLALTREALPHIRKVKGNIVFISSVFGKKKDTYLMHRF